MTAPADRSLLLVAGVSRSGSTMLDLVLGNRPDAFSCGEIYAWYRPFRAHHLAPTCACGRPVGSCPVWGRIGHPRAGALHHTIAGSTGAAMVVDSSKNLAWIADATRWARRRGMAVQVVVAWRTPRQIAYSYWKRGDTGWAENLLRYVERLDGLGVGYEVIVADDLIRDPAATLAQFYERLGTGYHVGQERFWEGRFHHLFGSGGTKAQLGRDDASLAAVDLPEAVLDHWHELPPALRARLDALDERMTASDGPAARRRPVLPPTWYASARLHGLRRTVALRAGRRSRD
jgi:hypothetical protein